MQATHVQSNFSAPVVNNSRAIYVQESSGVLNPNFGYWLYSKNRKYSDFLLVQEAYLANGKPQYTYLDDCARHWCHCWSLGSGWGAIPKELGNRATYFMTTILSEE